jgi:hypothetical protein
MPALHIRDVPEETVASLKQRAVRHGRSLEAELREILMRATEVPEPRMDISFRDRIVMSDAPLVRPWSRADAYSEELIDGR